MKRIKKTWKFRNSACSSRGVPESAGFLAQRVEEIIQKQFFLADCIFSAVPRKILLFHPIQRLFFLFKNGLKNTVSISMNENTDYVTHSNGKR